MAVPKIKFEAHTQSNTLQTLQAKVLGFDASGNVRLDYLDRLVVAKLATHIPTVSIGQAVLFTAVTEQLALVIAAIPENFSNKEQEQKSNIWNYDPSSETLTIRVENLKIEGIGAVEISCGNSSIRLNARGQILTQAEAITQAAIGPFRIEGASIDLN